MISPETEVLHTRELTVWNFSKKAEIKTDMSFVELNGVCITKPANISSTLLSKHSDLAEQSCNAALVILVFHQTSRTLKPKEVADT